MKVEGQTNLEKVPSIVDRARAAWYRTDDDITFTIAESDICFGNVMQIIPPVYEGLTSDAYASVKFQSEVRRNRASIGLHAFTDDEGLIIVDSVYANQTDEQSAAIVRRAIYEEAARSLLRRNSMFLRTVNASIADLNPFLSNLKSQLTNPKDFENLVFEFLGFDSGFMTEKGELVHYNSTNPVTHQEINKVTAVAFSFMTEMLAQYGTPDAFNKRLALLDKPEQFIGKFEEYPNTCAAWLLISQAALNKNINWTQLLKVMLDGNHFGVQALSRELFDGKEQDLLLSLLNAIGLDISNLENCVKTEGKPNAALMRDITQRLIGNNIEANGDNIDIDEPPNMWLKNTGNPAINEPDLMSTN